MAKQKDRKHIVCLHLYNDYSGTPLVLSEVIEGLRNYGYQIHLYSSGNKTKGFLSDLDGIDHHYLPYKISNKTFVFYFRFIINQLLLFFSLLRYWNEDVVIYINTMWPFAGGLAGRLMGKKVIYHLHEATTKPRRLKKFLFRVLKKSASDVIYVSRYLKQKNPVSRPDSHVVYNALSPDFLKNISQSASTDEFIVLMLCSLKKYKGINEFIQLSARLSDLKFELVVSATETEVNTFFKNDRFPENMNLYPAQQDVHPFYARASLVLNLSHTDKWLESFGLTVLEAMNYGIPAIVPPNGGISELVKNGYNGYKINVKELDEITNTIHRIAEDKKLYKTLASNSKQMARHFDYNKMIGSVEAIISRD